MPLETEQAGDLVERRLWMLSYSLLLAPVFLLSVIGIVFFDSPSTSGTRWLFDGDELAAACIGIVGVVIFGIGCTEALRHFRFSRNRDWFVWHVASCALLYLVVGFGAIMLARSDPAERGREYGVVVLLGAAAVWGIFLNALITAYTVVLRSTTFGR